MTIHDLDEGDKLTAPPSCCGNTMTATGSPADTVWDCQYGDSQIITDNDGLITEPPLIRCD
jgi:hypothetical protein